MVKARRMAPIKKGKSEETPEVDSTSNKDPEVTKEDDSKTAKQENGELDVAIKKTPKGKIAKKDEIVAEGDQEDDSQKDVQENGDGDEPDKKKPTAKKAKSTKKSKPVSEPARKSSRAPKPRVKEDAEDYEVEALVDFRVHRGKPQYLVRWKGYSKADDTWEGESSLNCHELLQKYKADHPGTEKKAKKRAASKTPVRNKAKKTKTEDNYEVEEIVNMRIKKGKREFLIRWKGYKPSDDSWEPESNLSCQDLIKEYMEQNGEVEAEEKKAPAKKAKTTTKSAKGRKLKTK